MPEFDAAGPGGGTAGGLAAREVAPGPVEDDGRGRVELYVDGSRPEVLAGAAAIGPDGEEWMCWRMWSAPAPLRGRRPGYLARELTTRTGERESDQ